MHLHEIVPWDGALYGRAQVGSSVTDFVKRHPITLGYLVVIWTVFLALMEPDMTMPRSISDAIAYRPALLMSDPALAVRQFFTAPWFHHDLLHIAYISVFFLMIAVPFEAHEGSARTAITFVAGSLAAAIAAGIVLITLLNTTDAAWVHEAAGWGWAGGSAGTFGLFGASIHRSRRPWVLVGIILAYEFLNSQIYLRNFTPVFHVAALAASWGVGWFVLDRPEPGPGPGSTADRTRKAA